MGNHTLSSPTSKGFVDIFFNFSFCELSNSVSVIMVRFLSDITPHLFVVSLHECSLPTCKLCRYSPSWFWCSLSRHLLWNTPWWFFTPSKYFCGHLPDEWLQSVFVSETQAGLNGWILYPSQVNIPLCPQKTWWIRQRWKRVRPKQTSWRRR